MKKLFKYLIIFLILLMGMILVINDYYINSIDADNNTLIITTCTGEMRGLETGIAAYAGYKNIPIILSDKTLPEQLDSWLPNYIKENNITKIILIGNFTPQQLINFLKLNVSIKQITGDSIADILTKIADNSFDKNNDTLIITASDPQAGVLGAYTKTPVFITATNSTYSSSDYLDEKYMNYIKRNNIKKVIIVGNLPDTIKNQLELSNINYDEISGLNSLELSYNINNKLKEEHYINNPKIAYYGFFGELPTIVPNIIQDNAVMIEDSQANGNIVDYLIQNNINTVYITRNTESDYIQMEETDYIPSTVINKLKDNNITIKYLIKERTLDEATGLYDMKIMTAQQLKSNKTQNINFSSNKNIKTEPPLIDILNKKEVTDSNNITARINKTNDTQYIVKWNTIHPYYWTKINQTKYYATSNTGYEYYWNKINDSWQVEYRYNNTKYYNTTWILNTDNSWTEIQYNKNFTWINDGKIWVCYENNLTPIYSITKII